MCEVMPDGDVSVRELRNHTAEVLRRVEAGERVRITVDRRPMAELGVHMTATRVALPIDDGVASSFAELVATARRAGLRPQVQDTWIAATARAHGVAVYAQDGDFDGLAVDVVRV